MVHIIYFCMHNLQLIGILAPTQNSEAMGPGSHNLKWKINFFSRFFKNELILSQNHLILHCNFFRALFVSLINFTGLFPPGVHCGVWPIALSTFYYFLSQKDHYKIISSIFQAQQLASWLIFSSVRMKIVLRPSKKFLSSSKTSKGIFEQDFWTSIFEPSEFEQEFFERSKIPSKTRASTSIFSSSNFEHFWPNRASKKSFFEQSSISYQNLTNFRS